MRQLHPRAFTVTVFWTLLLLYLGSVVHATESSLACPDWPTCYGTMVPEMTGGVFWEHLHRLVAGGLLLMWGLATWFTWKEARDRPWMFRLTLAGVVLLLVQSVFGGLTVLFRLPDLVSTTHLTLAFAFLALAAFLASVTSWGRGVTLDPAEGRTVLKWSAWTGGLIFLQSILGALVRHTDAGMACPDAPLCLGRVIPPLTSSLITLHFFHRVVGLTAAVLALALAVRAARGGWHRTVRSWVLWGAVLVLIQVTLGFVSVLSTLAVVPVSLHTLVAAGLVVVYVHAASLGWAATRHAAGAVRVSAGA